MKKLTWKIGFEIELLAPKGLSRQSLALAIAHQYGGIVRRFFHPQSEPSKVPGNPVFHNLTLGFEVVNQQGQLIARCVDDITLQEDLEKSCPPLPGWYRIVSDDLRLLHLIKQQANPDAELSEVLLPIAQLFGTELTAGTGGMCRVTDEIGSPIAIAAPLPGERERPCELITPPIETDHFNKLETLLKIAHDLGFTIPAEAATHFHFDATPLCSTPVFSNLVDILWQQGDRLRTEVGTNPKCRRLGKWPDELMKLVNTPGFRELSWAEAKIHLKKLNLSKYCDFNLKNFIYEIPDKNTFEARIFPGWIDPEPIANAAGLMENILFQALAYSGADAPSLVPGLQQRRLQSRGAKASIADLLQINNNE